jgi:hypothetical protein
VSPFSPKIHGLTDAIAKEAGLPREGSFKNIRFWDALADTPKSRGFTHGMVFQKPFLNQNPKNLTPWMSYGTAAPRPDRSRAVLHIKEAFSELRKAPVQHREHDSVAIM